eukprot:11217760-Lingulodinium_polyedra.AAC.1
MLACPARARARARRATGDPPTTARDKNRPPRRPRQQLIRAAAIPCYAAQSQTAPRCATPS